MKKLMKLIKKIKNKFNKKKLILLFLYKIKINK